MNDDLFHWATERDYRQAAEQDELVRMLAILRGSVGPVLAATLTARTGWSDRHCRMLASESAGRVLSTDDGYVLTERATPEQFRKANGRIYSQARKMLARAIRERKVWHAAGNNVKAEGAR